MTDLSYSTSLVPGTPENVSDVQTMFNEVKTHVNSSGWATDGHLESPNNSAYKTILVQGGQIAGGATAGTYILGTGGVSRPARSGEDISAVSTYGFTPIHFVNTDFTVAGKTQKLRLRAQIYTNATAWSSVTATFGIHKVRFSGAANTLVATLDPVVSGSTVELANPGASVAFAGESGDFTIPPDFVYCIGVAINATLTTNAVALLSAQLQTRHV